MSTHILSPDTQIATLLRPLDFTQFKPWFPQDKPGVALPGTFGVILTAPWVQLQHGVRSAYSTARVAPNEHHEQVAQLAERNGADPAKAALDEMKKALPAVSPAVFRENKRSLDNVIRTSFYMGDYDSMSWADWYQIRGALHDSGLAWFAYGSPSLGIAKKDPERVVHLRLCMATDRDMRPDETARVRAKVPAMLGATAWHDTSTEEPSRLFFVGTCGANPPLLFDWGDGVPLRIEALLTSPALANAEPSCASVVRERSESPGGYESVSTGQVIKFARSLQREGRTEVQQSIGRMIERAIIRHERYAPDGGRRAANLKITWALGNKFRHADPDEIADLFELAHSAQGTPREVFVSLLESAQAKRTAHFEMIASIFGAITQGAKPKPNQLACYFGDVK